VQKGLNLVPFIRGTALPSVETTDAATRRTYSMFQGLEKVLLPKWLVFQGLEKIRLFFPTLGKVRPFSGGRVR